MARAGVVMIRRRSHNDQGRVPLQGSTDVPNDISETGVAVRWIRERQEISITRNGNMNGPSAQ